MSEKSSHLLLAVPQLSERSTVRATHMTVDQLPGHIALTPEFALNNRSASSFYAAIAAEARKQAHHVFPISGEFEEAQDANDNKMRRFGGAFLYALHDDLLPIVQKFDKNLDTTNASENYDPHTAAVNNRLLPAGRLWISQIQIAKKDSDSTKWQLQSGVLLPEWK